MCSQSSMLDHASSVHPRVLYHRSTVVRGLCIRVSPMLELPHATPFIRGGGCVNARTVEVGVTSLNSSLALLVGLCAAYAGTVAFVFSRNGICAGVFVCILHFVFWGTDLLLVDVPRGVTVGRG